MGTGSSHNQLVVETLPDPATADYDSSDVVITKERRRPVRQPTIEKIVTETGAEVGKVRQDPDGLLDATSIHDDELKDIQDLEQTFDSLGIPSSSNLSSDRVNYKIPDEHLHESDLAPLKTKLGDIKVGVATSQNPSERNKISSTAISGLNDGWGGITGRSSSGPQARLDIPQTALINKNNDNNNNNTKSAPVKFTWNLAEPTQSSEEWIYQRVRQFFITFISINKVR
jgi:hypothetical protein